VDNANFNQAKFHPHPIFLKSVGQRQEEEQEKEEQ